MVAILSMSLGLLLQWFSIERITGYSLVTNANSLMASTTSWRGGGHLKAGNNWVHSVHERWYNCWCDNKTEACFCVKTLFTLRSHYIIRLTAINTNHNSVIWRALPNVWGRWLCTFTVFFECIIIMRFRAQNNNLPFDISGHWINMPLNTTIKWYLFDMK